MLLLILSSELLICFSGSLINCVTVCDVAVTFLINKEKRVDLLCEANIYILLGVSESALVGFQPSVIALSSILCAFRSFGLSPRNWLDKLSLFGNFTVLFPYYLYLMDLYCNVVIFHSFFRCFSPLKADVYECEAYMMSQLHGQEEEEAGLGQSKASPCSAAPSSARVSTRSFSLKVIASDLFSASCVQDFQPPDDWYMLHHYFVPCVCSCVVICTWCAWLVMKLLCSLSALWCYLFGVLCFLVYFWVSCDDFCCICRCAR